MGWLVLTIVRTHVSKQEDRLTLSVPFDRDEGILILSGGLTVHSFEDMSSFNEKSADPVSGHGDVSGVQRAEILRVPQVYHNWNDKVVAAVRAKGTVSARDTRAS